ncbi:MAG: substrate-binding domain-containing protein [Beijerinckiaceae bacterium]
MRILSVALMAIGMVLPVQASERIFLLGTTYTVEQSGILKTLIQQFSAESGITVRTVVQGTGQILKVAEAGNVDVVLTHDPEAEARFMAAGSGLERRLVMDNDFVLIGPRNDPASVSGLSNISMALKTIAEKKIPFISRGDLSGTHQMELRLWTQAGMQPDIKNEWYRETGSNQEATFNIAAHLGGYALADRATWAAFKNREPLTIVVENRPAVINAYAVMIVNPQKHPHVKSHEARLLSDWLMSPAGQKAIAAFAIDGVSQFRPAMRTGS